MADYNEAEVRNSLRVVENLFNKSKVNYRLLGSILISAINGKLYRNVADLDFIISKKDVKKVFVMLKKLGFKINRRKKLSFSWYEAIKKKHTPLTFLLMGQFEKEYFSYELNKITKLLISNEFIKPTLYKLYGVKFLGIPKGSVYEGIKISSLNPKRKIDKKILLAKLNLENLERKSIANSFKIQILGLEIPYLYLIFSYLYNFYGGLRVLFGKKYEVW